MSVSMALYPSVATIIFGCILVSILLPMTLIDGQRMILPNTLNGTLALFGAVQPFWVGTPTLLDACLGAVFSISILGLVASTFHKVRGIPGLGFGDLKFAFAAGLWLGWQGIAPMLLVASLSALAFFVARTVRVGVFEREARIPFGPFLAFGTFVTWLGVATGNVSGA